MGDRQIVLDANILVRATLGVRVRELIERYAAQVDLFAPDVAFAEAEEYLPELYTKRGLSPRLAREVYERVSAIVQELPLPFYLGRENDARARIGRRDPEDWPVLACALVLDCPVWTEDVDFFGTGVRTWTSDRVELFLWEKRGSCLGADVQTWTSLSAVAECHHSIHRPRAAGRLSVRGDHAGSVWLHF